MKVKVKSLNSGLSLLTSIIKLIKTKPITELVQLCSRDNILYIGMTNNITKIVYKIPCEGEELPTIVLDVNQLYKLVKDTTVEDMTIKYKDGTVSICGNGKYKQSAKTDEMGNPLKLDIKFSKVENLEDVDLAQFNTMVLRNKISLFPVDESGNCNHSELNRYYSNGDIVVSSDGITIAVNKICVDENEYFPSFVNDLAIIYKFNSKNAAKYGTTDRTYYLEENDLYYETPKIKEKEFPVETIKPFLDMKLAGSFDISKNDLKNLIKRLLIFSDKFTENDLILLKTEDSKVIFSTVSGVAEEEIDATSEIDMKIKLPANTILKVIQCMNDNIKVSYETSNLIIVSDDAGYYVIGGSED